MPYLFYDVFLYLCTESLCSLIFHSTPSHDSDYFVVGFFFGLEKCAIKSAKWWLVWFNTHAYDLLGCLSLFNIHWLSRRKKEHAIFVSQLSAVWLPHTKYHFKMRIRTKMLNDIKYSIKCTATIQRSHTHTHILLNTNQIKYTFSITSIVVSITEARPTERKHKEELLTAKLWLCLFNLLQHFLIMEILIPNKGISMLQCKMFHRSINRMSLEYGQFPMNFFLFQLNVPWIAALHLLSWF